MLDVTNCKKEVVIEFLQFQFVIIFQSRFLKFVLQVLHICSLKSSWPTDKLTPDKQIALISIMSSRNANDMCHFNVRKNKENKFLLKKQTVNFISEFRKIIRIRISP